MTSDTVHIGPHVEHKNFAVDTHTHAHTDPSQVPSADILVFPAFHSFHLPSAELAGSAFYCAFARRLLRMLRVSLFRIALNQWD